MKGAKQKLLVLASTFPRWSNDHIPSFVYELSRRLTENFEVTVLVPYSYGAKVRERIENIEVHRFKYWLGKKDYFGAQAILPTLRKNPILWPLAASFVLCQSWQLIYITKQRKIDLIHAHWIVPQGLLAVLYKKFINKDARVLITSHGADIYGLKSISAIKKWVLTGCSAVSVVSRAIREEVNTLRLPAQVPVEVIPMGVDLTLFHPSKADPAIRRRYGPAGPLMLFVGRLTEKKGVAYLLRAMPAILDRCPAAKLLIIGYGELEESLKELATELGLMESSVLFAGAVQNAELPRYYASADLFISPSITAAGGDQEGFGLVFVEAMGSGCLTVASDLPAITDIVIHGKTGFIVPQKDSQAIADTVIDLWQNQGPAQPIRTAARQYVLERYDWFAISQKYVDFLTR